MNPAVSANILKVTAKVSAVPGKIPRAHITTWTIIEGPGGKRA